MKSILLTTTALVAFAGAAVAEGHTGISWSGDAELGYNDDVENGFFWDLNTDVTGTAALDNGVTATASAELNLGSDTAASSGVDATVDELVVSISTEMASLSFGDVDPVAEANYGGVDGDSTKGFFDQDAHFDALPAGVGFDAMLVGEATVGGITAMLSYGVFTNDTALPAGLDVIDALQLYATGDFGMYSFEAAYQQGFGDGVVVPNSDDDVFAISGSASIAGADLTLAYIDDETESSTGFGVAYPVGPVTLGGYYSLNDVAEDSYGVSADYTDGPIAVNAFYDFEGGETDADADDFSEFGIEGSYDTGLNLTVLAGYITTNNTFDEESDAFYVSGVYDLGGGAELLVAYAEDEAAVTNDEIGDPEYLPGTTVEVSFSF